MSVFEAKSFPIDFRLDNYTMKGFSLLLTLNFLGGAIAAEQCPGSWYLEPDDCICMNSREGYLLKTQTLGCCKSMGYKTYDNVSTAPSLPQPGGIY